MARRYQHVKQWNDWLAHSLPGKQLLSEESAVLAQLMSASYFCKQAILVGVPEQKVLLNDALCLHQFVVGAIPDHVSPGYVEADYQELPIATGSVDLVVLPHTLEWALHPRQLLAEACRIVRPEGLIVVFGFNPQSLFKIMQLWNKKSGTPWNAQCLSMYELRKWLELAGFQIEEMCSFFYQPLTMTPCFLTKLFLSEWMGKHLFPYYGGLYMLAARAKVIPMMPIKMQWTQRVSGVRITSAISSQAMHYGHYGNSEKK